MNWHQRGETLAALQRAMQGARWTAPPRPLALLVVVVSNITLCTQVLLWVQIFRCACPVAPVAWSPRRTLLQGLHPPPSMLWVPGLARSCRPQVLMLAALLGCDACGGQPCLGEVIKGILKKITLPPAQLATNATVHVGNSLGELARTAPMVPWGKARACMHAWPCLLVVSQGVCDRGSARGWS